MSALPGSQGVTVDPDVGSRLAEERAPLALGRRLRPIVLGGARSARDGRGSWALEAHPEMILSVHSSSGALLGYAVVDRAAPGRTWGGMTIADHLSLSDVCRLARGTTLQIDLFSIRAGSHHCLVSVAEDAVEAERLRRREEYLESIRPLVERGLCSVLFTTVADAIEASLAGRGLVESATAATLAALEHLDSDVARATIALYRPTDTARDVAAALVERGLRLVTEGDQALHADADVVLVGAPLWSLGLREARAVRRVTLVALGDTAVAPTTERRLHERGVLFVPDAIAAAGRLLVVDLRARGLDERTAMARTSDTVRRLTREVLESAAQRDEPVAAVARGRINGALRASSST